MGFFGRGCKECAAFGIMCTQTGFMSTDSMPKGASSVIHTKKGRRFGCKESIDRCPAVQGKSTNSDVAGNINHVIANVEHFVVQPILKSRSSSIVIFESLNRLKYEVK